MEQTVRRLTRSRRDRVFAGICGGLASYLGWDVVLVRVSWVAITIFSAGLGIAFYILAWIITPLEDESLRDEPLPRATPQSNTRLILGVLLVVIGLLALGSKLLPWFWSFSRILIILPLVLILIGVAILLRSNPTSKSDTDIPPAPASHVPPVTERGKPPRLVRIHHGRKIAGVCSGLGAYFNVDPTLIRLLWVVLILAWGTGILLYILLWIAMPLVDDVPAEMRSWDRNAG